MSTLDGDRLAFAKSEIATMLGVSASTIHRMIRKGKLRSIRVGHRRILIPREEVQRLLRSDAGGSMRE